MEKMSEQQAREAIQRGEIGSDITEAAEKVAVILTQSWCLQWHEMRSYAAGFQDAAVFYIEYDKTELFEDFRTFKEETFGNDQIPYVRYYRGGKLVAQSNAVAQETFRANLER
ncbi:hypothetical protein LPW11_02935 [Geomonas sp. RF6]|uniref:hypothetical protein n=1 Tax=Geomonas sp. RF6 TaxID=2897342 RepID=UPI001E2C1F8E|nr:hypothetical protein [Geomonas sp. RF6]UFS71155.1 hypothetical protein LPW11_02935 [Geomonas sp. RF6]